RELSEILLASRGFLAADDVGQRGDGNPDAGRDFELRRVPPKVVETTSSRGLEDDVEIAGPRRQRPDVRRRKLRGVDRKGDPLGLVRNTEARLQLLERA